MLPQAINHVDQATAKVDSLSTRLRVLSQFSLTMERAHSLD